MVEKLKDIKAECLEEGDEFYPLIKDEDGVETMVDDVLPIEAGDWDFLVRNS